MDGEPAFPHREDLARVLTVVVPVERDFVEPRAEEAGQDRPLADRDDVVGRQSLAPRLPMAEPESDDDGERHQDPVPANDERADLEGDGARRVHVRQRISRTPAGRCYPLARWSARASSSSAPAAP